MPEMTIEALDSRRFKHMASSITLLKEASDLHRYGRESVGIDRPERWNYVTDSANRGVYHVKQSNKLEHALEHVHEDLRRVERALQLRGGLDSTFYRELLRTKRRAFVFQRHYILWQRLHVLYDRKADLNFTLGALDAPYELSIPPLPVCSVRNSIVDQIMSICTECARIKEELSVVEDFI
jgi:hypothetical protein